MAVREYRSPLRERRAADTRRRIVTAAGELFAEVGFAATTVAGIAERAGVAAPTVYATLGSKGAIVQALLERIEEDADAAAARAALAAENDPRHKLALFAQWHRRLYAAGRGVMAAAVDAGADPTVREMRAHGDRRAHEWHAELVGDLRTGAALRPGLTDEKAVDAVWALCGPELYLRVRSCDWSDDDYEAWLADLLVAQLLG